MVAHPKIPTALQDAQNMSAYLQSKGFDASCGSLYDEALRRRVRNHEFDVLISIGGDGTMLRAGHLCAPVQIPLLGINKGRLGFLYQTDELGWEHTLDQLMAGEYWFENRMMLRAEHYRVGELRGSWQAVNDTVIARGQMMRPIHISVSVDGQYLSTYVADGLITATATGSTAYALAAGGPILPPEVRNILIVPIAPHLSVDRALVLSEGATVSISVSSENAIMSIDGQTPVALDENDRVDVRASENTLQIIRFGNRDYFYRNLTAHMNRSNSLGTQK